MGFISSDVLDMFRVVPLSLFLVLLRKSRENRGTVFDELSQGASDNHWVNCAIEFPILAGLEPTKEIHQLSQFQIAVFSTDYLGEFIYLLNRELGFTSCELCEVP